MLAVSTTSLTDNINEETLLTSLQHVKTQFIYLFILIGPNVV